MKILLLTLLLSTTAYSQCYKTVGSKAVYRNYPNYNNVVEKYEVKADGRFLASFEPARNEEGEVIYESTGLEKIDPSKKEDYFKTECPVGMR